MAFFLLKANSEYLESKIIAGPFDKKTDCFQSMKKTVIHQLIELVGLNDDEALSEWNKAWTFYKNVTKESTILDLTDGSANIYYGSGYDECYDIVAYDLPKNFRVSTPIGDLVAKATTDPNRPGVDVSFQRKNETALQNAACIEYNNDPYNRFPGIF